MASTQLFWLKYAQAIKDKACVKDGVLFLSSKSLRGPVAGDNIPQEYTNAGLFDVGNSVLSMDNLFFDPSPELGYLEMLQLFLNWIDLGPHFPPPLQSALVNANRDFESSQKRYVSVLTKALQRYQKEQRMGITAGQTFADWIAYGRSPDCQMAQQQLQSSAARVQQIQQQGGGPNVGAISQIRAGTNQALETGRDYAGYNMRCAADDNLPTSDLVRKSQAGESIPTPGFTRKPSYHAAEYRTFAVEALKRGVSNIDPTTLENSIAFTVNASEDPSKFNFGQTTNGSNYQSFLSFKGEGEWSDTTNVDISEDEASGVSVKVFFSNLRRIDITPGAWSSNDLASTKPRADAPQNVRNLARVSSMLVASHLSYHITMGDGLAQRFGSIFSQSANAGGTLSVFGLQAVLDENRGSVIVNGVEHRASWDSGAKTLTVRPRDGMGAVTVVAMLGNKVNSA